MLVRESDRPTRRVRWLAAAGVVALVAALGATSASARGEAQQPIIIGAAIAQSGFLSVFDIPPMTALELAVADINRSGGVLGRPLRIVKEDTKTDRATGAAAAIKAIRRGAEIGVVTCDLDFAAPAAIEFAKKRIVSFSLCAGSPNYGPQGVSPYTFSAGVATPNEAAGAAEFAALTKRFKSAYILTDTTLEYNTTWTRFFERTFVANGGKVIGRDTYTNDDPTVQTQIARIKGLREQPDFIGMCGIQPGTPAVVRQIRAAGINLPLVMCVAMEGRNWLPSVPRLGNAFVSSYGDWSGKDPDPRVNRAFRAYVKKAGEPNSSHPLEGFGLADIIVEAIKRANGTNGPKMKAALEKFSKFNGRSGSTTFTKKWHISFGRPIAIKEIKDGKFVFVTKLVPKKVFYP
jgi:branched-chain amino acid transport system substrate-binding protein